MCGGLIFETCLSGTGQASTKSCFLTEAMTLSVDVSVAGDAQRRAYIGREWAGGGAYECVPLSG